MQRVISELLHFTLETKSDNVMDVKFSSNAPGTNTLSCAHAMNTLKIVHIMKGKTGFTVYWAAPLI